MKETAVTLSDQVLGFSGGTASVSDQTTVAPVFDHPGMMARLLGDEDLARVVIEAFLEDIPQQIVALRGYLDNGDVASVERQAHTIKGASANVNGEALRAIALKMEMDGKAGNLAAVNASFAEMESQFYLLKEAIIKEL